MCIFRPSKLHQKRCVESTWIFRPAKLHRKKYVESTWIFRPLKLHRKSTRKWSGNLSKFGLRRIDVTSTSNRCGFDVVCPLGISLWTETFMTRLDQLLSLNLIFIRFTTPALIKNNDSASESWTLPPPMKKAKSFENKAIEKKYFIPKSLPVIDLMKLGKLIWNKERSSAKGLIEKFNMENNGWSISKEAIF